MSSIATKTLTSTQSNEALTIDPAGAGNLIVSANNWSVSSAGLLTAVDFNSTSDVRLKENITPILNASDAIRQLQGVAFTWKETGDASYGLIAQEVEKVIPALVDEVDDVKRLKYLGLIAFLLESVKELQDRVTALESRGD